MLKYVVVLFGDLLLHEFWFYTIKNSQV